MLNQLEDSFSVVLASTKSSTTFNNNSSCFSNSLGRSIDVSDYSVCLRSITFHDNFRKPPPWERLYKTFKETKHGLFFKEPGVDNLVILTKEILAKLVVSNAGINNLPLFTTYLNEQFLQYDMRAYIVLTVVQSEDNTTEYRMAKLVNLDTNHFDFLLPWQISRMYGFTKTVFSPGDHYNTLPIAPEYYASFSPSSSWIIEKRKLEVDEQHIAQMVDPKLSDIIAWISVAVLHAGGTFNATIDKEFMTMEYILGPENSTLKISDHLGNFLGLGPDAYLTGRQTIPINAQMVDPYGELYIRQGDYQSRFSLSQLLVVSNCVTDSFLFDSKFIPCVAVIQREEGSIEKVVRPKKPVFYSGTKSILDNISIKLMTDSGKLLPVTDRPTIVELFFQKLVV